MKPIHLATTCALAVAAMPAFAQTSYSSRADFQNATTGLTTETFESCGTTTTGFVGSLSASSTGPCGAIVAGVTFSPQTGGRLYIAAPGQSANANTALGVDIPDNGRNIITFDQAQSAFGADFNQNFGGGDQLGQSTLIFVEGFSGATQLFTFSFDALSGQSTFFGITSTSSFDRIEVRQPGGYAVVDNVSFGAAANAVPEPATWAMMIAGFGAVGLAGRRRTRAVFA